MSKTIGIDLGTTNSCVAVMEGAEPLVIPNAEGSRTTPSVVAFAEEGEPLVGQLAKRQAVTNAENTVYCVKRMMGRKFDSPEVKKHAEQSAYAVVASDNGDAWVKVRDKTYPPAQISAFVLEKMRKVAEDYTGGKVTDAVVTVPAYFSDAQRQATKDAGRIAGLNVQRIINEPTAAALAYGSKTKTQSARLAVYDLGGGTFDISLLQLEQGVYQVKGTSGDGFLGGEDFDRRIIDFLAENFLKENNIDLRKDRMALQRLRDAAEKAKHELSSGLETEINLPFIAAAEGGTKHLITKLTRGKLETLTKELVERTFAPIERVLADARWQKGDVDDVLLVGGQTRMPMLQEMVEGFFGKKPSRAVSPDEAVAMGAALQGAMLSGDKQDVLLLDVAPLSLGVETGGGVFTRIIPRNTTIPTRMSRIFTTAVDNQPFVNVKVLQGEREMAADNTALADFQLTDIPPAPRGGPEIEVMFDIDANGVVRVSAKDKRTGREQKVEVQAASGLNEEKIKAFVVEAEAGRAADLKKKEWADLRNKSNLLTYGADRALLAYGAKVPLESKNALQDQMEVCKQLFGGPPGDPAKATEELTKLEAAAQKMFAFLGGGEGEAGARPAGADGAPAAGKGEFDKGPKTGTGRGEFDKGQKTGAGAPGKKPAASKR